MTTPHPNEAHDTGAQAQPDDDLFGIDAYDEMLEACCTAFVGNEADCSLTCAEHCAGEDELLRWAKHYDARVGVARDQARNLASAHTLLTLWHQAPFLGDWNPRTTDLTDLLPR